MMCDCRVSLNARRSCEAAADARMTGWCEIPLSGGMWAPTQVRGQDRYPPPPPACLLTWYTIKELWLISQREEKRSASCQENSHFPRGWITSRFCDIKSQLDGLVLVFELCSCAPLLPFYPKTVAKYIALIIYFTRSSCEARYFQRGSCGTEKWGIHKCFHRKLCVVFMFDRQICTEQRCSPFLQKPFPAGGPQHSGLSFLIYVEVKITERCCALPALVCWLLGFALVSQTMCACILDGRISDAEIVILCKLPQQCRISVHF